MLLRSVDQKCWSEKLIRKSVAQKCCSEDQKKCGSEVLMWGRSKVSLRSVNQKLCSDVSLRSLVCAGKSHLCSTSIAREVQVSGKSQLGSASLVHEAQVSSPSSKVATLNQSSARSTGFQLQLENRDFVAQVWYAKHRYAKPSSSWKSQPCST